MSKRNRIILETKKSKRLKALRLKAGLSLRKLAEEMNISHMRVHQMESGRDNISESYIDNFLEAASLDRSDWGLEADKQNKSNGLREKCHEVLDEIEQDKLELVYGLLTNFS